MRVIGSRKPRSFTLCRGFGAGGLAAAGWLAAATPCRAQGIEQLFAPVEAPVGATLPSGIAPEAGVAGAGLLPQLAPPVSQQFVAPAIHAGGVLVRPEVRTGLGYNSNVEGFSGGRGSTLVPTDASLAVDSNWSRDSLSLATSVSDRRYLDLPGQSFTNWSARLAGSKDLGRGQFKASFTHYNLTQTPDSLNVVTVAQPVTFRSDVGQFDYLLPSHGPLHFTPGVTVTRYDYDNYLNNGQAVSQAYRNRVVLQAGVTSAYEAAPGEQLLLVVRGTHIGYTDKISGLPGRDSNGGAVLAGVDFPPPSSNFRIRLLAGYQTRHYVSGSYSSLSAPIVEGSVAWAPTRLTTLVLNVRRDIEDAADDNIAGYTYSAVGLRLTHELRYNVLLRGQLELDRADYQSSRISIPSSVISEAGSSQTIYSAGVSATWLLNRYLHLDADYTLTRREGGASYLSNIAMVTLGLRL